MFYLRDGAGSPLLAGWFALACLPATLAAHTAAILGGADMVRVHDVKEAVQAAKMADALKGA